MFIKHVDLMENQLIYWRPKLIREINSFTKENSEGLKNRFAFILIMLQKNINPLMVPIVTVSFSRWMINTRIIPNIP